MMEITTVDNVTQISDPLANITLSENEKSHKTAYTIGAPLIGFIIVVANSLVIASTTKVIKKKKDEEKATYLFMGSLSFSDAFMGLLVGAGALIHTKHSPPLFCYIHLNLILASTMASLLFMVLMSLDRYLYIVHSMQYETLVNPTRAKVISGVGWVYSLAIGFIPISIWKTDYVGECIFVLIASKECVIFMVVVGLLLPIASVFLSYTIVLFHVIQFVRRKSERQRKNLKGMKHIKGQENSTDMASDQGVMGVSSQVWRAFGACVIIVGAFVFTWMPYFIAALMYYFCSGEQCQILFNTLSTTLAMLGLLNSLLNPVIYTWWQKGFWSHTNGWCECLKGRWPWKRSSQARSKAETRAKALTKGHRNLNISNSATDSRSAEHSSETNTKMKGDRMPSVV